MQEVPKYGSLLTSDIKLHRQYFKEMCKLIGIQVIYLAPKPDVHYSMYTEILTNHQEPELIGCIFTEHPNQRTLKKMGWVSELQEGASIIHVAYDLHDLQQGALFMLPSGLDDGKNRLFRVSSLSNIMVYPASIACEVVPEYMDTMPESKFDHQYNNFNLLANEDFED